MVPILPVRVVESQGEVSQMCQQGWERSGGKITCPPGLVSTDVIKFTDKSPCHTQDPCAGDAPPQHRQLSIKPWNCGAI